MGSGFLRVMDYTFSDCSINGENYAYFKINSIIECRVCLGSSLVGLAMEKKDVVYKSKESQSKINPADAKWWQACQERGKKIAKNAGINFRELSDVDSNDVAGMHDIYTKMPKASKTVLMNAVRSNEFKECVSKANIAIDAQNKENLRDIIRLNEVVNVSGKNANKKSGYYSGNGQKKSIDID